MGMEKSIHGNFHKKTSDIEICKMFCDNWLINLKGKWKEKIPSFIELLYQIQCKLNM